MKCNRCSGLSEKRELAESESPLCIHVEEALLFPSSESHRMNRNHGGLILQIPFLYHLSCHQIALAIVGTSQLSFRSVIKLSSLPSLPFFSCKKQKQTTLEVNP